MLSASIVPQSPLNNMSFGAIAQRLDPEVVCTQGELACEGATPYSVIEIIEFQKKLRAAAKFFGISDEIEVNGVIQDKAIKAFVEVVKKNDMGIEYLLSNKNTLSPRELAERAYPATQLLSALLPKKSSIFSARNMVLGIGSLVVLGAGVWYVSKRK